MRHSYFATKTHPISLEGIKYEMCAKPLLQHLSLQKQAIVNSFASEKAQKVASYARRTSNCICQEEIDSLHKIRKT